MLPGTKSFWVHNDRCAPWEFQVKCVPQYWELTLWDGHGLEVIMGENRRE